MQHSLPLEFIKRIENQLEKEANSFFNALESAPVVSIRWNPSKKTDAPLPEPVLWHEWGEYLAERPSFTQDPLFHAGAYYVQEASSMLIHQFLEPEKYHRVLDLCAAPGGKSTLLASALKSGTLLISNEVIRSRAAILAENMTRWGNSNVVVTQNDASEFKPLTHFFDCILIDAPCSGEGMFRKDKDSINEWSEENVMTCAARQKRILADIIPSLAIGGHLIYSTCTYSIAENEGVIDWVLTNFPEMELSPVVLPAHFGTKAVTVHQTEHAAYRCYPHLVKGEGFFVTRFTKKGNPDDNEMWEDDAPFAKQKKGKPDKNKPKKLDFSIEKQVLPFCWEQVRSNDIVIFDENVFYFPLVLRKNIVFLSKLYLLKKGVLLGKIQGNELTPSHEFAMSDIITDSLPKYELTLQTALSYLQKNDLPNESPYSKGWILATYQGVTLGWLKVAGNRLKNHFPINWRIRNLN